MIAGNTPPAVTDVAPPAPPAAPAAPRNGIMSQPAAETPSPMFARLLRMADGHLARGSLWQAREIYLKLMDDGADSVEAKVAADRLLRIAEQHERDGKTHLARSLYERLM